MYLADRDDKGRVVIETNNNREPLLSSYQRMKRYCNANAIYDPKVIQAEHDKWVAANATADSE